MVRQSPFLTVQRMASDPWLGANRMVRGKNVDSMQVGYGQCAVYILLLSCRRCLMAAFLYSCYRYTLIVQDKVARTAIPDGLLATLSLSPFSISPLLSACASRPWLFSLGGLLLLSGGLIDTWSGMIVRIIVSGLLCPGASARRLRCTARHTIPLRNGV